MSEAESKLLQDIKNEMQQLDITPVELDSVTLRGIISEYILTQDGIPDYILKLLPSSTSHEEAFPDELISDEIFINLSLKCMIKLSLPKNKFIEKVVARLKTNGIKNLKTNAPYEHDDLIDIIEGVIRTDDRFKIYLSNLDISIDNLSYIPGILTHFVNENVNFASHYMIGVVARVLDLDSRTLMPNNYEAVTLGQAIKKSARLSTLMTDSFSKDNENFEPEPISKKFGSSSSLTPSINNLVNQGWHIQDVAPYGNCFFEAIAFQLARINIRTPDGMLYTQQNLRALAVQHLRARHDQYTEETWMDIITTSPENQNNIIINNYLAYMEANGEPEGGFFIGLIHFYLTNIVGRNGVFADNLVIQALANALHININIINAADGAAFRLIHGQDTVATINILYTGNHYMAINRDGADIGTFTPYTTSPTVTKGIAIDREWEDVILPLNNNTNTDNHIISDNFNNVDLLGAINLESFYKVI